MSSVDIATTIINTASAYGVDPRLALEVAMRESNLNQSAVSPAGAIGIFQLEPATAADLGVDPTDVSQNITGGVRYLLQLLSRYGGDLQKTLGAYNWGLGNVDGALASYGADWLAHAPAETQHYVAGILANIGKEYTVTPGSPITPLPGVNPYQPPPAGQTPILLIAIVMSVVLVGLWAWNDAG